MSRNLTEAPDYMAALERASQQFLSGASGGAAPQPGNAIGSPAAMLSVHQAYMQFQGTAQILISRAQHDIERRDDKLASLGEKYEEQVRLVDKLGSQVEELMTKMKTTDEQHILKVGTVEKEKEAATKETETVKTQVETLTEEITKLKAELEGLKTERETLIQDKADLEKRVETLGASKVVPPTANEKPGATTETGEKIAKTATLTAEEMAEEGSDSAERTRCVAVFKEYMLRRDEVNATGGRHRLNEFHTWRGAHSTDIEKGREFLRASGDL